MNSEKICDISDEIINKFKNIKQILIQDFSIKEKEVWLKHIKSNIKLCNKAIRNSDVSIGSLRKLQTNLGHLKVFQTSIQNLSQNHVGKGLGTKKNKISGRVKWMDLCSAFKGRVRTGIIINLKHKDLGQFLTDSQILFSNRIKKMLKTMNTLKVNCCFCGEFLKQGIDQDKTDFKYFNTANAIIDEGTDISDWFQNNIEDKINNKLSEFSEKDSGWALSKIISLEVNINKFEMGNGGSSYIKLPKQIENKKACVNIQNNDNACFYWAIVSALYPVNQNITRPSSYIHYNKVLKTDNFEMPMIIKNVSKFEKLNDISVNIYMLELGQKENKTFYTVLPARLTTSKLVKHVNLLLIQNIYYRKIKDYEALPKKTENTDIKYHYCWIKSMSRLLSNQLSKKGHKKFICDRCLNYFSSQDKLNTHSIFCEKRNNCKISFPKDMTVKFQDFVYKQKVPFIVYADFETMLIPYTDKSNLHINTHKYQHHKPYSAGYYLKCDYDNNLSYYKSYEGIDCMDWFAKQMSYLAKKIYSKIKNIEPITENPDINSTNCHICEKPFSIDDVIVRDHNHFTGHFRGFAHQLCNLHFMKKFVVPIVFHNLSGYDSHFIIKDLARRGKISLLPINKEKYISFTLFDSDTEIKFRFIDSLRFMGASLDELASSLQIGDLQNLNNEFKDLEPETFSLITRKGVFCYDYVDSIEKLKDTELPNIDSFFNRLLNSNITDSQYEHAKMV